ncbi:MAG: alpha-E domain-containing protein [Edaphocola sp.]
MLSRVAENLFWMARYMERTNAQLRIVRTLYVASQDGIPFMKWEEVYKLCNAMAPDEGNIPVAEVLNLVLFDKDNEESICSNVFKARENARSVQDHITIELWQCLNDFYHLVKNAELPQRISEGDPISVLDSLIMQCMYYYGIVDNFMFRGEGFYFLNLGKYIERSLQTVKSLSRQYAHNNGVHTEGLDLVSWRYFLFSMSGYEFYLKSNAGLIEPKKIFNQVMSDSLFPHSVAYCLQRVVYYGEQLSVSRFEESSSNVNFAIGKADAVLRYKQLSFNDEDVYEFFSEANANIHDIISALNINYFGLNQ